MLVPQQDEDAFSGLVTAAVINIQRNRSWLARLSRSAHYQSRLAALEAVCFISPIASELVQSLGLFARLDLVGPLLALFRAPRWDEWI